MFHTIRQNGSGSAYVLIRLLEVLARVDEIERVTGPPRRRSAATPISPSRWRGTEIGDPAGLQDCEERYGAFMAACGPTA